jgi:hypothetical protein
VANISIFEQGCHPPRVFQPRSRGRAGFAVPPRPWNWARLNFTEAQNLPQQSHREPPNLAHYSMAHQPSETRPLLPNTTGASHSSPGNPGFTLRRARFSDLAGAARTCSLAFWDDVLFGRLIHPWRNQYPLDSDKYWYRRFVVDWWDWSHVYLVTTETVGAKAKEQREIVTGFAHWSRIAPGRAENRRVGWELAWWDPSKYILVRLPWNESLTCFQDDS